LNIAFYLQHIQWETNRHLLARKLLLLKCTRLTLLHRVRQ
jgi:hypothetical protein